MNGTAGGARELGGVDVIDAELAAASRARPWSAHLRRTAAMGLAPAAAPALVLVPVGVAIGPHGLGFIGSETLGHLDVVVSVALAALGVFVGLALDLRSRSERRLLIGAGLESLVTMGVVAAALALLLSSWGLPSIDDVFLCAAVLGVCAAASSAGTAERPVSPAHRIATRVAELDDALPVALGGAVLVWNATTAVPAVVGLAAATAALGILIAAAGWLLFEHVDVAAERGTLVLGTLVLLAGTTAFLSLSPLLAGLAAGLFWRESPGRADAFLRTELSRLQHPLVVVLLVVAGASITWSAAALWLSGPYLLFRMVGKLAGGWAASRLERDLLPSHLGAYLIPPGVLGLAFALAFDQVSGSGASRAILSAVAVGSLGAELLGLLAMPHAEGA